MRYLIVLFIIISSVASAQRINTSVFFAPLAATSSGNMISNGTFDDETGWVLDSYWSIGSGVASYDALSAGNIYQIDASMVTSILPNTTYTFKLDITATGFKANFYLFNSDGVVYYDLHISYEGTANDLEYEFTTPSDVGVGGIRLNSSNWTFSIDNISITEN